MRRVIFFVLLSVVLLSVPVYLSLAGSTKSLGGNSFSALKDVTCSSPSDNHGITYDSATAKFVCEQLDHGQMAGLGDADHNAVYFQESEFIATSAGSADKNKPIKLDADGNVDATMVNDADIDHGSIGGLSDADHNAVYFQESEFLNSSAGAGDAGKPVKLDAGGHIDATMINDADVSLTSASATGWIEEICGHILSPSNDDFFLVLNAKYARQIVDISIKCGSGTITAALEIDGTVITTCTGISVTSTEGTTTCDTGASNDLAVGETLELVTSSDSSCADLLFCVKTTRD